MILSLLKKTFAECLDNISRSYICSILISMHIINFLITILLPYLSFLTVLRPDGSIPDYFLNDNAAFMAGEFYVIVFFWAGLLRNMVSRRVITERFYFGLTFTVLILMCLSKIVLALPYTWIISSFAFGLGVLSATRGQSVGKISLSLMILISLLLLGFSGFILIGMAWFDFNDATYNYYVNLIHNLFSNF